MVHCLLEILGKRFLFKFFFLLTNGVWNTFDAHDKIPFCQLMAAEKVEQVDVFRLTGLTVDVESSRLNLTIV